MVDVSWGVCWIGFREQKMGMIDKVYDENAMATSRVAGRSEVARRVKSICLGGGKRDFFRYSRVIEANGTV
jgi:hypothetical protein